MAEATMDRGSFLSGALVLVIGGVVWVIAKSVTVPGLGDLQADSPHPTEKHGLASVAKVLIAMRALDATFFQKWGPCLDGIWRIIVPNVSPTEDGIIVLKPLGKGRFSMKTAFPFDKRSRYAKGVLESCFGPGKGAPA